MKTDKGFPVRLVWGRERDYPERFNDSARWVKADASPRWLFYLRTVRQG
jgi:hypothetical protein